MYVASALYSDSNPFVSFIVLGCNKVASMKQVQHLKELRLSVLSLKHNPVTSTGAFVSDEAREYGLGNGSEYRLSAIYRLRYLKVDLWKVGILITDN